MRRYEGNLKSQMINMHQEQWYLTALWFSRPLIMALTVTIMEHWYHLQHLKQSWSSCHCSSRCRVWKANEGHQIRAPQSSEMRVEIVELRSTQKSSNLLLRHVLTPIWQVTAAQCSSWTISWSKDNLHAEKKHPKIHKPKEIFSHKRILFEIHNLISNRKNTKTKRQIIWSCIASIT